MCSRICRYIWYSFWATVFQFHIESWSWFMVIPFNVSWWKKGYWKTYILFWEKQYYSSECFFTVHVFLKKIQLKQSLLNQRWSWRDSKPNSWQNFSLDVPITAPVIPEYALYRTHSLKKLQNVLSYSTLPNFSKGFRYLQKTHLEPHWYMEMRLKFYLVFLFINIKIAITPKVFLTMKL